MTDNYLKKDAKVLARLFGMVQKTEKTFVPVTLIRALFQTVIPLLNIVVPAWIIDEMLGAGRLKVLLTYVLILAGGNAALGLIRTWLDRKWEASNLRLQHGMEVRLGEHVMGLDYEKIESPSVLDLKERALYPIRNQNSLNELIETVCTMITAVFSLLSLSAILLQTNGILILGILLFCLLQFVLLKKVQKNMGVFMSGIPVTMRRSAYYENLAADYEPLKEIQLYRAKELLLEKLKKAHQDNVDLYASAIPKNGVYEGIMGAVSQIQLVFVYGWNIVMLFLDRISVGDFTMYVNAASKFAENMMTLIKGLVTIHQDCRYMEVYLEFMELKPTAKTGKKEAPKGQDVTIEFQNVSFHYPNREELVLKNVSASFRPGEKISIVGMNGAGKTTFIKLLCRLLIPTEGEILLNGVNINEYSEESYTNLIATVFQDFQLFSFSIRDNIDISRSGKDVGAAIRQAGIEDWVKKCSAGEKTQVTRLFDEKGVEPSGGEGQKLAIARAIYKNAPVMVMDEPTAALDPYTEYEIYRKFDEISAGKTVFYISHRLGCCQLCDRVLVFADGQIAEQGSHEELKEAGGVYSRMWNAQAKFYVKE